MPKHLFSYIIVILLFGIVFIEILFFKDSDHNFDPAALPYQSLKTPLIGLETENPAFFSGSFSDAANWQTLALNQGLDATNLYTLSAPSGAESLFALGAEVGLDDFSLLDINHDQRAELLYTSRFFDRQSQSPDRLTGVLLCALDQRGNQYVLNQLPLDSLANPADIGNFNVHSVTGRFLLPIHLSQASGSEDYFALGFWGSGSQVPRRWVLIINRQIPASVTGLTELEFYPTFGLWQTGREASSTLTLCGSSYKYGTYSATQNNDQIPLNVNDFVDDRRGGIVQLTEHGAINWRLRFTHKVGETGIWESSTQNNELIAFYIQDLLTKEQTQQMTVFLRLNGQTGALLDSNVVAGAFFPFTGSVASQTGLVGIQRFNSSTAALVNRRGELEKPRTFHLGNTTGKCPLMALGANKFAFAVEDRERIVLSDLNGNILATAQGQLHPVPVQTGSKKNPQQLLIAKDETGWQLIRFEPNSPLWWLKRWKFELAVILLLPVVLLLTYWVRNREQRAHEHLMKSFNVMEEKVDIRTRDLARVNQTLAREITQRQQAEEDLRHQHQHLESIYNSVFDAIITLDSNLQISRYNTAFAQLVALDPDAPSTPRNLRQLIENTDEALAGLITDSQQECGVKRASNLRVELAEDVQKIVQVTATPLTDHESGAEETLLVLRDVTQLYRVQNRLTDEDSFYSMIGTSEPMRKLFHLIQEVAPLDTTVLVTGESGTGKELTARAIHFSGPQIAGEFVAVNCAAIPENLIESELFGHVKGAFTGATRDQRGLFEAAQNGTLFLDEIGELPVTLQAKLLRVLQDGQFNRVGEVKPRTSNARIIAATNKDLKLKITDGSFREDLYYRLTVFAIQIPPLRGRPEDLPLLIEHFQAEYNETLGRKVEQISSEAMEHLLNYSYPGNVRELRNIINGAMILCHEEILEPRHFHNDLFQTQPTEAAPRSSLSARSTTPLKHTGSDSRDQKLVSLLQTNNWNVSKTAKQLSVSRTYIYKKLKQLNIEVPR